MPLPLSSSAYLDVKEILDRALASGGGTYTLPTPGKAMHWRARANKLRALLRASGITSYDQLTLRIQGSTVEMVRLQPEGVFTSAGLAPLVEDVADDPLMDEATALRASLLGGK